MEIILKQEVENLGYKDQIINVKPGYANNFLIPQGYAVVATTSAKKMNAENIRQRAHKEAKMIENAQAVVSKLEALTVTLTVKSNASGKIFGSVTAQDVASAIAAKGIDIDKRSIKVGTIKEVGAHTASVKLYKEIGATIKLDVISVEAPATETEAAAE